MEKMIIVKGKGRDWENANNCIQERGAKTDDRIYRAYVRVRKGRQGTFHGRRKRKKGKKGEGRERENYSKTEKTQMGGKRAEYHESYTDAIKQQRKEG